VVAVCAVQNDVCGGGFLRDERGAVEVAVYESDVWVLRGDFGAFGGVADEGGDGKVGVGVRDGVQGVAAYVACCAGAGGLLVGGWFELWRGWEEWDGNVR
jgi:hypothetical protein